MEIKPATPEAYQLMHEGAICFSQIEHNGICIDEAYLNNQIERLDKEIKAKVRVIKEDPIWRRWKKRFGEKARLSSRYQLGEIIFGDLGYRYKPGEDNNQEEEQDEPQRRRARYRADEETLSYVEIPFVSDYLDIEGLIKDNNTFLRGIQSEVCHGKLHGVLNLHIPITYRSSSDSPNLHNFPVRDPEKGKLIQPCFIPRKGRKLAVIDIKQNEVKVGYCYHKDPTMRNYLLDDKTDMHRDMAAQCYTLKEDQVTKEARYSGKNQFVFAEFYGSYYIDCAKAMWNYMEKFNLKTPKGTPVKRILAKHGITKLGDCIPMEKPKKGTFENHIMEVEKDFWGRRFKIYDQWRKDWYAKYQKRGWIDMFTGFVVAGSFKRNQIINTPVQGAAFHVLLKGIILLQKWLNKNKMKSLIINEIHDSIWLDCPEDELDDVVRKAVEILTVTVPKLWSKWICIPFAVDVEVSGTNMYEKKKYKVNL